MLWMGACLEGGSMILCLLVLISRVKARYYDVDRFEDGDFRL